MFRPRERILCQDLGEPRDRCSCGLIHLRLDGSDARATKLLRVAPPLRQRGQPKCFDLRRAFATKAVYSYALAALFVPAFCPVTPRESRRLTALQRRERGQAGPLRASGNETFLHTMREDVARALHGRVLVRNWLSRVPPREEPARPTNKRTHLASDIALQQLHEASDLLRCIGAHNQVEMICREDIGIEVDVGESYGASQCGTDELVSHSGRVHEQARLRAARGYEVQHARFEVPDGISHGAG